MIIGFYLIKGLAPHRYHDDNTMKACKTPGAQFHIRIGPRVVSCQVDIPFDLSLTKDAAISLEDKVHDALEGILQEYWSNFYWKRKEEEEFELDFNETFEELLERRLQEIKLESDDC